MYQFEVMLKGVGRHRLSDRREDEPLFAAEQNSERVSKKGLISWFLCCQNR